MTGYQYFINSYFVHIDSFKRESFQRMRFPVKGICPRSCRINPLTVLQSYLEYSTPS